MFLHKPPACLQLHLCTYFLAVPAARPCRPVTFAACPFRHPLSQTTRPGRRCPLQYQTAAASAACSAHHAASPYFLLQCKMTLLSACHAICTKHGVMEIASMHKRTYPSPIVRQICRACRGGVRPCLRPQCPGRGWLRTGPGRLCPPSAQTACVHALYDQQMQCAGPNSKKNRFPQSTSPVNIAGALLGEGEVTHAQDAASKADQYEEQGCLDGQAHLRLHVHMRSCQALIL